MKRRTLIIGAVAGGIGLAEYTAVSHWLTKLGEPRALSVKSYEKYGEQAALVAITPNDEFYVTSKGLTPRVDRDRWQLRIDGLVSSPLSLGFANLLALPPVEKQLTLECISNPIGGNALGNAKWTGTPLLPLLERAGPAKEASYAIFYAADGFTTGHPLSRLLNKENFIAYRMNGQDLPSDHGYPARLFIPGKFGMKQPKWFTRIELASKPPSATGKSKDGQTPASAGPTPVSQTSRKARRSAGSLLNSPVMPWETSTASGLLRSALTTAPPGSPRPSSAIPLLSSGRFGNICG